MRAPETTHAAGIGAAWLVQSLEAASRQKLDETEVTALTDALRVVRVARGTVLYRHGERTEGLWIIMRGTIELSDGQASDGPLIGLLGPGDIIGDASVLLGAESPTTARAVAPTDCLFLSGPEFNHLMRNHPALCMGWLCHFALSVTKSRTRLFEILGRNLTERTARLLVEESSHGELWQSQETMARMLGVQRTSLNKVLKRLESKGLIEISYGHVVITDMPQLQRLGLGEAQRPSGADYRDL